MMSDKPSTVLIALAYNDNGMATWVYEATRAMRNEGFQVWLAYRHPAVVPADLVSISIEYKTKKRHRNFLQKLAGVIKRNVQLFLPVYSSEEILTGCLEILNKKNIIPDIIILNQTSFVSSKTHILQWVVAWSWPVSFSGYLSKMKLPSSHSWFNRLRDYLYWYKMDHKGYRMANGVIAITNHLAADLKKLRLNAHCVYPGTNALDTIPQGKKGSKVRLITVALGLEDKRKNIQWLVEGLMRLPLYHRDYFEWILVGAYSEAFFDEVTKKIPEAKFTGKLMRSQLLEELWNADVFLFASVQDDWGYVLIEAMAQGLAVMAPDQYPFIEIIEREDYLFDLNNPETFTNKLDKILCEPNLLEEDKAWFFQRFQTLFSGKAFGRNLARLLSIEGAETNAL